MTKHKLMVGHNIKIKIPKIRILLKREDLLDDHLTARRLDVHCVFRRKSDEMQLFMPANDQLPEHILSMQQPSPPFDGSFVHAFSCRGDWEPGRHQTIILHDGAGKRLPFSWDVSGHILHDHNDENQGIWIWLERSSDKDTYEAE